MAKMNPSRTLLLRNLPSTLATIAVVLFLSRNDCFGVHGFNAIKIFLPSSYQRSTNNNHHRNYDCPSKIRRRKSLSGQDHSVEKEQQNGSLLSTITSLRAKSTANEESIKLRDQTKRIQPPAWLQSMRSTAAAGALAVTLFWTGGTIPAATAQSSFDDASILLANTETTTIATTETSESAAMDVSELMKSLQPATPSRPQIPFPTNEALRQAQATGTSSSNNVLPNPLSRGPKQPIPQENLLKENPYTLPALVNLGSVASKTRPYNGADALVLKVWANQPADNDASSNQQQQPPLGGAKIPIAAVVGGFPVRVSLGPTNAVGGSDGTTEWKRSLSSQSLWVTGAVCKDNSNNNNESKNPMCTTDYPTAVLDGVGFSKWIDLSPMVEGSRTTANDDEPSGVRAPVSLVLEVPR